MRLRWALLLVLMSSVTVGLAQSDHPPLISFRATPKPKFFLTFDRTGSIVGGKPANTNEIKMGLEFRKKIRLGIGFGALVSDVVAEKRVLTPETGQDSMVTAQLSLSFFSLNAEYIFYDSKRWQIAMPVGMGFGTSYFSYFEKTGEKEYKTKRLDEGGVVMFNAHGLATYRILRWIGLSGGVGYRVAVVSNSKVEENFNSPVYIFKVRIFLGEIYKSVFPRGISGKRNPPYTNDYWD